MGSERDKVRDKETEREAQGEYRRIYIAPFSPLPLGFGNLSECPGQGTKARPAQTEAEAGKL